MTPAEHNALQAAEDAYDAAHRCPRCSSMGQYVCDAAHDTVPDAHPGPLYCRECLHVEGQLCTCDGCQHATVERLALVLRRALPILRAVQRYGVASPVEAGRVLAMGEEVTHG